MEELILSLYSAFIGFFFSQFFNLVTYFRRPKFRVINHSEGVLSAYSGDPPETPWEIELGFFLENVGKNPSKNMRIFVSEICIWDAEDEKFQETAFSFSEISRPIDILPSRECIKVYFAKISSDSCCLEIRSLSSTDDEGRELISSETRFAKKFRAKFYVICDDKNSSMDFVLEFDPGSDREWSAGFLEDYDTSEFRQSIVFPKSVAIGS